MNKFAYSNEKRLQAAEKLNALREKLDEFNATPPDRNGSSGEVVNQLASTADLFSELILAFSGLVEQTIGFLNANGAAFDAADQSDAEDILRKGDGGTQR